MSRGITVIAADAEEMHVMKKRDQCEEKLILLSYEFRGWGLGNGEWGLGDWGMGEQVFGFIHSPIPYSPISTPHFPIPIPHS